MSQQINSYFQHFRPGYSINCGGKLLDLHRPIVMGILNVTPDSFYDGGKFTEESSILEKVRELVAGGAQIIDIGAASSRPGAQFIDENTERQRLIPTIRLISMHFPDLLISVDTWRSTIGREAIANGAHIINDISGGELDPEMFKTVGELGIPYILMHMQGTPDQMQVAPDYENVLTEVIQSIQSKVSQLRQNGVKDIIIDPGFGFGKSLEHNYTLLNHLDQFHLLECPILVGFSRKSMINKVLKTNAETALNGTTILNTIGLMKGAHILRVHDAREAYECTLILQQLEATLK